MDTKTLKGDRGWFAESKIDLPNSKVLTILTMKRYSGKLITTASVSKIENGVATHAVYQDFTLAVAYSEPKHITAKVVEEQHNLIDVHDVIQKALVFYGEEK